MAHVLCKLNNILPQFLKLSSTCYKSISYISSSVLTSQKKITLNSTVLATCRSFHATGVRQDLSEFFDDPKNFVETEVKTGRAWRKDDLRIKSNSDLHKLWYVLLKEKNMLLSMEAEYERLAEPMPNPERIYKIEESMKNLETVVRERNRAYNLLETGHDGERPTQLVENVLGMHMFYRLSEHMVPHFMNTKWKENVKFNNWDPSHVVDFKRRLREKRMKEKARHQNICKRYVKRILKKYPNASEEAILEKYPYTDFKKVHSELDK